MRRFPKIPALGLFALFLGFFAFHAAATTYYVDINSPDPTPPYTNWNTASTGIQSALNQTTNGDLVLVNPGIYFSGGYTSPPDAALESVLTAVVITNAIALEGVNGAGATIINGSNTMRCVFLGTNSTLAGFTITNGAVQSDIGNGIYCASTNTFVTNCVITHCQSGAVEFGTLYNCILTGNAGGGAINSSMFGCVISNNIGNQGGGVFMEEGVLSNCMIVSNTTTQYGGGVYCFPIQTVMLINCLISNNVAQYGGGFYSIALTNCTLDNCILTQNHASTYGGGACKAVLNNCLIISNSASSDGGGAYGSTLGNSLVAGNSAQFGGGVYCESGYPSLLNNCIISNNTAQYGGGVYNDGPYSPLTNSILDNCILTRNSASDNGGGAFGSTLNNCLIVSNSAGTFGGGADVSILNNCLAAGNSAASGGAIGPNSVLRNCTIAGNSAFGNGGGLYCPGTIASVSSLFATNCIVYENNAPTGSNYLFGPGAYTSMNYCCTMPLSTPGIGSITNDPAFVNPVGGNYHLQSNSPCINAGNNAGVTSTTDLDGNLRIVGGTVDIGAYEYQTPTSVISYAWLQQYGLPTDGSVDFADLDGTAFNVYQDWVAGLNPTNPASVLAMFTPAATNNAHGIIVTYFLQRSTNLFSQPAFLTLQPSNLTGQPGTTSYTDTSATNNFPYFYRVGVLAP
jgi:hypothetical protein